MAAWEFCPQDGCVSEGFTHKMAAWEICLQDGSNAAFLRVYPQDGGDKQNVNKNNVEYILCSLDISIFFDMSDIRLTFFDMSDDLTRS